MASDRATAPAEAAVARALPRLLRALPARLAALGVLAFGLTLALVFVPRASAAPASPLVSSGGRLLLGSLVVAGLLWGAAVLVRRLPVSRFLPRADGPIRVVGRTYLGAKESLCLVEVGPTTLLLAVTGTTIRTLHVWPEGLASPAGAREHTGIERATREAANVFPGQLEGLRAWVGATRR
jgi:flagellar protein FliO/FliZ